MDAKKVKITINESTFNELKDLYDHIYIPSLAKMNDEDRRKTCEAMGDTFEEFVDGFIHQNIDGIKKTNEMMAKFDSLGLGDMKDMFGNLGLGDISNPEDLAKKLKDIFPFGTEDTPKKEEPKKDKKDEKDLKN